MTDKNQIIKEIRAGETSLGIEFGSTRIKAVLVGERACTDRFRKL